MSETLTGWLSYPYRLSNSRLSGVELARSVTSTNNVLALLFISDLSIVRRGYSLVYTAEPIPSSRRSSTGSTSSILLIIFFLGLVLATSAFIVTYLRSHTTVLDGVVGRVRSSFNGLADSSVGGRVGAAAGRITRVFHRGSAGESNVSLYFEPSNC